jgi:hypothetical protein
MRGAEAVYPIEFASFAGASPRRKDAAVRRRDRRDTGVPAILRTRAQLAAALCCTIAARAAEAVPALRSVTDFQQMP